LAQFPNDPNDLGTWPTNHIPGVFLTSTLPVISNLRAGVEAYTSDGGPQVWNGSSWVSTGAASGYLPPFTGSVLTSIAAKLAQTVSVLDFAGVDPSGATDSTAGMIAAHATGKMIYYPAGNYHFNSDAGSIPIPGGPGGFFGAGIIGDGAYQTFLTDTGVGSNDCFNYTGSVAGRFENFQLRPFTSKTGGYGIRIGPASGEVSAMRVFQIVINSLPNGINFSAASRWSVIASQFYSPSGDAITVNNTNVADSGDSSITNCDFENNSPGSNLLSNGIRQIASGGLKITANKFNNLNIGYLLDLGLSSTSDLLITGNSFENSHTTAIQLQRTSGSAVFSHAVITGNEILVSSTTTNSIGVLCNNGAAFLSRMIVNGNVFNVADTGTSIAISIDWVTDPLIDANVIRGPASGTTSQAIVLGTHNTRAKVGINQASGFAQRQMNWPAGTNYIASDFQSGTTSVSTSSALGSIFSGTTTITFPQSFSTNAPPTLQNCSASVTSVTGGGIASEVVSVTATQLVINVIGVTNGGSVPIQWSAGGVF